MEKKQQEKKNNKKAAVIAALAAITLLLAGTYAWTDYSQHKSNEFSSGEISNYDVTLVEDFKEVTEWMPDQTESRVAKRIYVQNNSETDASGEEKNGAVYVRLQLKEYLETGKLDQEFSTKRYMIDTDGEYITSDKGTDVDALADIKAKYSDPRYSTIGIGDLVQDRSAYDTDTLWYVVTKGGDANGQYGKFLLKDFSYDVKSLVPGQTRSYDAYNQNTHHAYDNDECDYTVHLWGDDYCTHGFHDYISWELGNNIQEISYWDGFAGRDAKWYLDTSTGWAYWGVRLEPGDKTTNLLNSVNLEKHPGTEYFYYTIHADMEAISPTEKFVDREQSAEPVIDDVAANSDVITGGGVPGATIKLELPSGSIVTTTVPLTGTSYDEQNYPGWIKWSIDLNDYTGLDVAAETAVMTSGAQIVGWQTEKRKLESNWMSVFIP